MSADPCGRPRVGVSSCLLGGEVRFNGGHKRYRFLTDELGPYVDWVPYCPEVSIGLGTPREAIRLTAAGRLVNRSGTADHTAAMAGLPLPPDLDGYVFKAKSDRPGARPGATPRPGGPDRGLPARRGTAQRADRAARPPRQRWRVQVAGGADVLAAFPGLAPAAALHISTAPAARSLAHGSAAWAMGHGCDALPNRRDTLSQPCPAARWPARWGLRGQGELQGWRG